MADISLKIFTPERTALNKKVYRVVLPYGKTNLTLIDERAPTSLLLNKGIMQILETDNKVTATYFIDGGVVDVAENICKISTLHLIAESAITAEKAAAASGKNARPRSSPRRIQPKSQKPNRRRKNSAAARSGQAPGSATTHSARRATTTAAPGAAPNAASARNANLPASRGGRSSQFEGSIKMAGIMDMFSVELDKFVKDYDDLHWDVSFRGEAYPPRIIMEQSTPPLYRQEPDGTQTVEPNPVIQIIGRPDLQVITTGKLAIRKRDLTKMVNGAAALLELFLHGFMQERKEMEAAQND